MYYYEVAPLKIVRASSAVFTYHSTVPLTPGQIVLIPVGKQTLLGLVLISAKQPSYTTKPIETVLDMPPLPKPLLDTALWMSEYYHTHLALVLQTILPRGLTKKRRLTTKKARCSPTRNRTNFVFNEDQRAALTRINEASPGTILLHGITGSGKTAIYIDVVRSTLESGRSALLLVPEIALTSQLISEFKHLFPDVILVHSKQTEAERHRTWLDTLRSAKPHIVIGPRSALFTPLASIGVIIIDEAHEPSYKQDQSPRYSALRVASVLGRMHHAKIIQGSATPLVSEYYLAAHAQRPIIEMKRLARKDAIAPTVTLIDMKHKSDFTRHRFFSNALLAQIESALADNKQALVFHNRRGSAATTLCKKCGWSATCSRCFVPLTLHADQHVLRCHICNLTQTVLTSCPECGSTDIIHKGIGTKLIESELKKLFPTAHIGRFDGDTTSSETVDERYQELYDGTIDIIIGTQVIAKGLDLPELRVVGVVQADAGLSLPDYSAPERTFQLLAQVVGRVGRSAHQTNVVIQSYQPDADAVRYGIAQDYASFYDTTIAERRRAKFPPFVYLLKLTCLYKTEAAAIRNAQQYADFLRKNFPDLVVLGPTPAFYERQHDTYRWQLVVKSSRRAALLDVLQTLPTSHWQFDLDPASLL